MLRINKANRSFTKTSHSPYSLTLNNINIFYSTRPHCFSMRNHATHKYNKTQLTHSALLQQPLRSASRTYPKPLQFQIRKGIKTTSSTRIDASSSSSSSSPVSSLLPHLLQHPAVHHTVHRLQTAASLFCRVVALATVLWIAVMLVVLLLMIGFPALYDSMDLDNPQSKFYNETAVQVARPIAQFFEGIRRFTLTTGVILLIGLDYWNSMSSSSPNNLWQRIVHGKELPEKKTDEHRELLSTVHRRNAERLLRVLRRNKGVYIKVGQQIAAMKGLIPNEFIDVMKVMRNHAPTISYQEVEKVIQQDFGYSIEEMFLSFEKEPIAAASLAQVHRAVTKDGRTVAVKVQYPHVRTFFEVDMFTRDVSSRLATRMYYMQEDAESIDQLLEVNDQFGKELKDVLRSEMDFRNEAENAQRAARDLRHNDNIYIPAVLTHLISPRVLTMEFIDNAVHSADIDGIRAFGFKESDIMKLIINAFAEQVFIHGFFHSDPHPANIMVRQKPNAPRSTPQVVILDHGLYKQLSNDFRQQYAEFWEAVVLKNESVMEEYCQRLGINNYKLYASMIMMQSYDRVNLSSGNGNKSDFSFEEIGLSEKEMEQFSKIMEQRKEDFMNIYRNMPKEMMLLMRCDNLLRSLNQELGAPVNRFAIMARTASRGVHAGDRDNTWPRLLNKLKHRFKFEFSIFLIQIKSIIASLYVKLFGYSQPARSLESIL